VNKSLDLSFTRPNLPSLEEIEQVLPGQW